MVPPDQVRPARHLHPRPFRLGGAAAAHRHPGLHPGPPRGRGLGRVLAHANLELCLRPLGRPRLLHHPGRVLRHPRPLQDHRGRHGGAGAGRHRHDGRHPLYDQSRRGKTKNRQGDARKGRRIGQKDIQAQYIG